MASCHVTIIIIIHEYYYGGAVALLLQDHLTMSVTEQSRSNVSKAGRDRECRMLLICRNIVHCTRTLRDMSCAAFLFVLFVLFSLLIFRFVMYTHTRPFNGSFSGTARVSRYQKGKTSLDFTEARDSEWHWHQLGHMQVRTSLQTDDFASTPPLSFLQAGCPSATQPTASKH